MGVGQLAHLDEVLGNLGDSLLALVDGKVRPVLKLLVDLQNEGTGTESESESRSSSDSIRKEFAETTHLLDGLGVVVGQLDLLPHLCWRVSPLNRLDVEVGDTWPHQTTDETKEGRAIMSALWLGMRKEKIVSEEKDHAPSFSRTVA